MADTFFSYDDVDHDRIEPVVQALEADGWSVWWDRDIPAGQTFDEVIERELGEAKCVVVAWSRTSAESRWVRTEAGEAANRDVLVPFQLEDCKIPLAFRRIQAAQLEGWDGSTSHPGYEVLTEAIARLCGPAGGAAAPAATEGSGAPAPSPSTSKNWRRPAAIGVAILAAILLVVAFTRTRKPRPKPVLERAPAEASVGGETSSPDETTRPTRPTVENSEASGAAAASEPEVTPPATQPEDARRIPVHVVRIHMSAGTQFASHGFLTPLGKIVAFAPTVDAAFFVVSWEEGGRRKEGRAKVLVKRKDRGMAPFLALLEPPAALKPQVRRPRIRKAGSLSPGERVELYLSPDERTPGKVIEVASKRTIGGGVGGEARISRALTTTYISGPGDAGGPVLDGEGRLVAVLVGGGRDQSISIPIEIVKVAFPAGF